MTKHYKDLIINDLLRRAHPYGGLEINSNEEGFVEDTIEAQIKNLEMVYRQPTIKVLNSLADDLDSSGLYSIADNVDKQLAYFTKSADVAESVTDSDEYKRRVQVQEIQRLINTINGSIIYPEDGKTGLRKTKRYEDIFTFVGNEYKLLQSIHYNTLSELADKLKPIAEKATTDQGFPTSDYKDTQIGMDISDTVVKNDPLETSDLSDTRALNDEYQLKCQRLLNELFGPPGPDDAKSKSNYANFSNDSLDDRNDLIEFVESKLRLSPGDRSTPAATNEYRNFKELYLILEDIKSRRPKDNEPGKVKPGDGEKMLKVQKLINQFYNSPVVAENGNEGDQQTWNVVRENFKLMPGKDFKNYDVLITQLKSKIDGRRGEEANSLQSSTTSPGSGNVNKDKSTLERSKKDTVAERTTHISFEYNGKAIENFPIARSIKNIDVRNKVQLKEAAYSFLGWMNAFGALRNQDDFGEIAKEVIAFNSAIQNAVLPDGQKFGQKFKYINEYITVVAEYFMNLDQSKKQTVTENIFTKLDGEYSHAKPHHTYYKVVGNTMGKSALLDFLVGKNLSDKAGNLLVSDLQLKAYLGAIGDRTKQIASTLNL